MSKNMDYPLQIACQLQFQSTGKKPLIVAAGLDLESGEIFDVAWPKSKRPDGGVPEISHGVPRLSVLVSVAGKSAGTASAHVDLSGLQCQINPDSQSKLALPSMTVMKVLAMMVNDKKARRPCRFIAHTPSDVPLQEYSVTVTRIAPQTKAIAVVARSPMHAGLIAGDQAGSHDFAGLEKESEYVIGDISLVAEHQSAARRRVSP